MDIYKADDYRRVLKEKIEEFPNSGHGKMSEISRYIGVHTTLVSQVIKGHKDLSVDQALLVAKFFGLSELETDYLTTLLLYNRAGNQTSKKYYNEKVKDLRKQSRNISKRVKKDFELNEEQKAIYYSDWTYSAICQSVALENVNTVQDISTFLNIGQDRVVSDLEFLFEVGLVIKNKNKISYGVSSLHLSKDSPWIRAHHLNWRQKGIESLSLNKEDDLHYSAPLTISKKDAQKFHDHLIEVIEKMREIVDPSPCEEFYCFNMDWFNVGSGPTKR